MLTVDRHKMLRLWRPLTVFTCVLIGLGPLALRAQATTDTQAFQLRVSEKEMMLKYTERNGVISAATRRHLEKDLSFQRRVSRSMPYVELWNDGESTLPIMQLRMTIGDEGYHFGNEFFGDDTYAKLGETTQGYSIQSSVSPDGDELIVDFLNGGLPRDEIVRFRIDIDSDDGSEGFPDYRDVLFDTVAEAISTVSITFYSAGSAGPIAFEEYLRPQGISSGSSSCCCGGGNDALDNPFSVTGQITLVPEPGSIVLCMIGLLGGVGVCRRYRARA